MKILFKSTFATEKPFRSAVSSYRGNYIDFVATILNYAVPAELSDDKVKAYYQPMDGEYSDSLFAMEEVESSGNIVTAHWLPSYDVGASKYRIWIECNDNDGTGYPAMFEMEMLGNPVYDLNPTNPPAKKILDFSKFELVNAPWVETADFTEALEEVMNELTFIADKIDNIDIDIPTDYAKEETLSATRSTVNATYTLAGLINTTVNASDASNYKIKKTVDSLSTTTDSIKETVEGITIPTDYAKETTLNAVKTAVDGIDSLIPTDYAKQATLTTSVANIRSDIAAISIPTDYATSAQAVAIKNSVDSIVIPTDYAKETTLGNVESKANDIQTDTQSIYSTVNSMNMDVYSIKNDVQTTRMDVYDTKSNVESIKTTVEGITIPSDYAKEASLSAASTLETTHYNSLSAMLGDVHSILEYIEG